MISYEEFKKDFLEKTKAQAEKEGWDNIACYSTSKDKPTYTWREIYEDLVNETGAHGNTIRTYYKYKYEKATPNA